MPYVPKPPRGVVSTTSSTAGSIKKVTYNANGSSSTITEETQYATWTHSRRDGLTRNKPRLIPPGLLWKPCTGYTASFVVERSVPGVQIYRSTAPARRGQIVARYEGDWYRNNFEVLGPYLIGTTYYPTAPGQNTLNRLYTELMQKVAARKTNYGESLAEARSTIKHLSNSAVTLFRAYQAARKGQWSQVARTLKVQKRRLKNGQSASERWLEYQFGWMPLMSDIYDSHALLTEGFRKKKYVMSSVRQLRDVTVFDGKPQRSSVSATYGKSVRVDRAKVFYSVKDTEMSRLAQMGLINPLEVAWAVVPFSFVVDWFLPVGNFLEALTARLGVDFIDGSLSTIVTTEARCTALPDNLFQAEVISNTIYGITSVKAYRRSRLGSFPIPGLYFKDPFSSSHLISALALVRQLAK